MRVTGLAATVMVAGVVMAGCASGGAGGNTDAAEGPYGALSVEEAAGSFLDAARRQDYPLMRRLFGTSRGPAERELGRVEVEQRMLILSRLLRHDSYSLRRMGVAMEEGKVQVIADMVGTRNGNVSVPFITTQHQGRWFVEQVVTGPLSP